ncbi:MAG TPA: hypothetical protein DCP91_02750 [Eggerthellaceae bacterium]|nr:hypothetical protein [Eggerthellaceae bacterium]
MLIDCPLIFVDMADESFAVYLYLVPHELLECYLDFGASGFASILARAMSSSWLARIAACERACVVRDVDGVGKPDVERFRRLDAYYAGFATRFHAAALQRSTVG